MFVKIKAMGVVKGISNRQNKNQKDAGGGEFGKSIGEQKQGQEKEYRLKMMIQMRLL
jgi:hypothetical protein